MENRCHAFVLDAPQEHASPGGWRARPVRQRSPWHSRRISSLRNCCSIRARKGRPGALISDISRSMHRFLTARGTTARNPRSMKKSSGRPFFIPFALSWRSDTAGWGGGGAASLDPRPPTGRRASPFVLPLPRSLKVPSLILLAVLCMVLAAAAGFYAGVRKTKARTDRLEQDLQETTAQLQEAQVRAEQRRRSSKRGKGSVRRQREAGRAARG